MTTIRIPRRRVPMCPGCGLYPHTHNWAHRRDCIAQQIPEHEAIANIAEIFGTHLTPQSAAELQQLKERKHPNDERLLRELPVPQHRRRI